MNNTRRSMIYLHKYDGKGMERLTSLPCVIAARGQPIRFNVYPEGIGTSWTEDSIS